MRGNRMKTRAFSFLLALAMILTMVPAQNLQAAEPAGEQPAISGAHGDLLFQNGEATVNLSDGESAEASGLPADVAYTVTENGAEADGYTVKSEGAAGEILPGEISEVRFENHKDAPVSAAGDSARTGDDSPVMLYLASALLALLLVAFALLLRRRLKR